MLPIIRKITKGFCLFTAASMLFSASVIGDEIELKFASWATPKHFASVGTNKWIAAVNKKSAGKVKLINYPGGQLYGSKDAHKAVAKGMVDGAQALQPRMMAMFPILQGVYLPFLFDDIDQVVKAYQGESRKIIDRELAKKNLVMVFAMFNDGVQLYSNSRNIQKIEDFKGLRLLTTSPIVSKIFSKLGAAPDTSIPYTEQYMALKRKIADATTTTIVAGYFRKNYEVCQYITKMDISFATMLVVMNRKKWLSLPHDVRQTMMEEGKKQTAYSIASSKGWLKKFTGVTAKKGGIITKLPDAERKRIKETSKVVWNEWANRYGSEAKKLLALSMK